MMTSRKPIPLLLALVWMLLAGSVGAHPEFSATTSKPISQEPGRPNYILQESFDDAWLPTGWAVIDPVAGYSWDRTTAKFRTGVYSAWLEYGPQGTAQDEWLVTSAVDLSAVSGATLEFYEDQTYWEGYGEAHYVYVSTTSQSDPSAFTMLAQWSPADHVVAGFEGDPVTVSLNDYVGEAIVYVAFRYTGTWADNWYIDDVSIYSPDPHDVGIAAVLPDMEQFAGGAEIIPQVLASNTGSTIDTFTVELIISESGAAAYTENVVTTLAPAEELLLDFPSIVLVAGQYYHLDATALLAGDSHPGNNTGHAMIDTYTEQRRPLAYMHTNSGCGPCASAEIYLEPFMASYGDQVSMIRVHTWWPGYDIIYVDSQAQSDSLINEQGADYTPHLWVDGLVDAEFYPSQYGTAILSRLSVKSPLGMEMSWDPIQEKFKVDITGINPMDPAVDYKLKLALTEDDVYFSGGNGILYHDQSFRAMFPSTLGIPITPVFGETLEFEISCTLDPAWDADLLNAVAFVVEANSSIIWQSDSGRLSELQIETGTPSDLPAGPVTLGAYPNPFNPSTMIHFRLPESGEFTLELFDIQGQHIGELDRGYRDAGEYAVEWNGRDKKGQEVSSGLYLVQLRNELGVSARAKLVLIR